jgi:hypothetical protein
MNVKENLRILFVCDDDAIRFSRELLLNEAGYEVKWLPSNASLNATSVRCFDVAIICQSVNWKRAAHLSASLRRLNPTISTVRVNTLRSAMESRFEVDCGVVTWPGSLVQVLDSLNGKSGLSCAGQ